MKRSDPQAASGRVAEIENAGRCGAASAAIAESRRIQVGTLTCSLSASIGLIVGSQRNVSCLFRGPPGEPDKPYTGTMTRVGLDLGLTTGCSAPLELDSFMRRF